MAEAVAAAAMAAHQQAQLPAGAGAVFDQQQLQQMSAMMAMAAAGVAGNSHCFGAGAMSPCLMPGGAFGMGASPLALPFGGDQAFWQAYAACGMDPTGGLASAAGVNAGPLGMMGAAAPYAAGAPTVPVISVSVEGMRFQYQLTQDDLHKVFSRYGSVSHIFVDEAGTSAQITFQDFQGAQAAVTDLNGKVLNGLDGTLRLVWANQGPTSPVPPYPMMPLPFPNWGFPGASATPWSGAAAPAGLPGLLGGPGDLASMLAMSSGCCGSCSGGAAGLPSGGLPGAAAPPERPGGGGAALPGAATAAAAAGASASPGSPERGLARGAGGGGAAADGKSSAAHVKGVRKYTCRFLIGIENDKEFQVVRRIIGAKGANMKRIVRQTEAPPAVAGAKLRLRGVGSGYFEGAGQRESAEPLQLCVSCTSSEGYRTAVKLVEELLETVYAEYRQFCRETGRTEPELRASPQLVSGGGRSGATGGGGGSSTAGGNAAGGAGAGAGASGAGRGPVPSGSGDGDEEAEANGEGGDDDEDGEGEVPGSKREGRRRGRRSRAKRGGAAAAPGVDRTDPPPKAPPVEDIERFIDARNEARRQCNFTEADRIRQNLHERGVALMDEPGARGRGTEVTTWRYWRE